MLLNREQICELIPHRDPFLWLDEVVEFAGDRLLARKRIDHDLDVFRGHYPGQPVLPGVILCEAAMQAGAVLIALGGRPATNASDRSTVETQAQPDQLPDQRTTVPPGHVPVATRINNVKFRRIVRPGDTLAIEVRLTDIVTKAYFLSATLKVEGQTVAQLDFGCALVPA